MNIKKCLWLFFLCFLSAPSIQAQRNYIDIPNYILCINSYAESTPWSTRMISTISEYVQKDPQLALYAEHMNTFMIDNDSILKEFKNMLSQKYTQPHPRLLVLLGSPAFTLRDEYRKLWGDIPIVLCSEEAFQGPHEAYLQKQAITERPDSDRSILKAIQYGFLVLRTISPRKCTTNQPHKTQYKKVHIHR